MKKPIYSFTQFPHHLGDGPLEIGFYVVGPLGKINNELVWRLTDFCRIHQIVYKEILRIDQKLGEIPLSKMMPTVNVESMGDLAKVRLREAVFGQDSENKRVTSFVDHMTVVRLWAIAEQFMGKTYRQFVAIRDSVPSETVSAPYRWDDFIQCFDTMGISLNNCENFDNANECKLVNNAIKHDPVVGSRLSDFSYFSPYVGEDLENVPLEMQRYLNGVSDFLGSLIEKSYKLLIA